MGAEPSIIAQYSDMIPGGGMSFAEARENARGRFNTAIAKVGREVRTVTIAVLCHDETAGRNMGDLRDGLRDLARHYGFI